MAFGAIRRWMAWVWAWARVHCCSPSSILQGEVHSKYPKRLSLTSSSSSSRSLHASDGTPNQGWPAQANVAVLVLVLVSHGKTRSDKCQRVSAVCADDTGFEKSVWKSSLQLSVALRCSMHPCLRAFPGKTWGSGKHATRMPLSCSEHLRRCAQNMPGRCLLPRPSLATYWQACSGSLYRLCRTWRSVLLLIVRAATYYGCCCALVVPLGTPTCLQFQTAGHDAKAAFDAVWVGPPVGRDLYANLSCACCSGLWRGSWSRRAVTLLFTYLGT
jgi:hypothetical protein